MIEYDISDFPTILLIDANETDSSSVAVITQEITYPHTESVRAQEIVPLIGRALEEAAIVPSQIRAICVLSRAGSLTGQRIGVSIANTLSWLAACPIIELRDVSFSDAITFLQSKNKFSIHKTAHAN